MKKVTILLTSYNDIVSNFVSYISNWGFSHASISIDPEGDYFYSFNYKGFVVEKPRLRSPKSRKKESVAYVLYVDDETYNKLEAALAEFLNNPHSFNYSRIGVALCFLHIPHKFNKKYFCSQFVAEVLRQSGTMELQKHESLYLPNQFVAELEEAPHLDEIIPDYF
ncbi:MAG: hypothetical protein ACRCZJ_00405 [Erysipelotrichaceae bacterium]